MTLHAACAPSSASMWLVCPASITKAAGRTRPSSKYAREGTAAHRVAELIIGGNLFPPNRLDVEGEEILVSRGMLQHLNEYISIVQGLRDNGWHVVVEKRISLPHSRGLVWGTADCIAWTGGTLRIIDLKFGKGVMVEPDSDQLKIYAIMAITWAGIIPENVVLTICQPRTDPLPKSVMISRVDLWTWRDQILYPALDRIDQGSEAEVAGPHCRWCVRKSECKAFAQKSSGFAAKAFDDGLVLP